MLALNLAMCSIIALPLLFKTLTTAAPISFPLANGFPDPSPAILQQITSNAGGPLPSLTPGTPVPNPDTLNTYHLLAFNELSEVAFFEQLLANITSNVPGFTDIPDREYSIEALAAISNQEQLHTINFNNILRYFGEPPAQPCTYEFPVNSFEEAIDYANHFSDAVLGTTEDCETIASQIQSDNSVPFTVLTIGQAARTEGEQNGWFRQVLHRRPSSGPFATRSARPFAMAGIMGRVVPGSCPEGAVPNIPALGRLQLITDEDSLHGTTDVTFSFLGDNADGMSMVWLNGASPPIVVPIQIQGGSSGPVNFSATFPHDAYNMDGYSIAVLVNSEGPFTDSEDVAAHGVAVVGIEYPTA